MKSISFKSIISFLLLLGAFACNQTDSTPQPKDARTRAMAMTLDELSKIPMVRLSDLRKSSKAKVQAFDPEVIGSWGLVNGEGYGPSFYDSYIQVYSNGNYLPYNNPNTIAICGESDNSMAAFVTRNNSINNNNDFIGIGDGSHLIRRNITNKPDGDSYCFLSVYIEFAWYNTNTGRYDIMALRYVYDTSIAVYFVRGYPPTGGI